MPRSPAVRGSSETVIVRACIEVLARMGIFAWRQNTGALQNANGAYVHFGKKGCADITGILSDGRRLEVECKRPGEKQSEDQIKFQHIIEGKKGIYFLVHSAQELLDHLVKGNLR